MGEASSRKTEIDAAETERRQRAMQMQQVAAFTTEPATFVNGLHMMTAEHGSLVRFTLHETAAEGIPARIRFSGVCSPSTLRSFGAAFAQMADAAVAELQKASDRAAEEGLKMEAPQPQIETIQ